MPKQTYTIRDFHGGISSDADPRDMSESEYPDLVDVNIDSVGRVKTLGGVTTTSTSNTLQIYPNKGLFTMGSDKQLDGGSSNETFIIAYDDGSSSFDIRDSEGWDTAQISMDSDLPVFYVADGNLRIIDGEFDNAVNSAWFGYINYVTFESLNADSDDASYDSTSIGWTSANQKIASPTVGNCLISTPFPGSDSNGVNSSSSEYIGNVADASGEDVADVQSVNLRVGLQYSELLANLAAGWAGTNVALTDKAADGESTYHPLIANNNVKADSNEATDTSSGVIDVGQSYSIDDENVVIFGFYITAAEYADLARVVISHFTSGDASNVSFVFSEEEIKPDCWNLLVCSSNNIRTSTYTLGETLVKWAVTVIDTNGSAASPTFWMSGPVVASSVPLTGFQPGFYSFYHTYLYDEEKQESLPYLFTDTGSGNVNKINVVGAPVLFNFDTYINPYNSAGSPVYTISKRVTGSRLYYKLQENDNFYLIGELDFVKKGFKWFPEGDTMSYSMSNTTNTTGSFFSKACLIKGILPASANGIDTFRTINGFSGNTESLSAKFKTATIQGRRVYGGNVRQNSKNYPDRMLKSQVNKFDVFPDEMGTVDVVINDGESIVALESFADRILQFKEKTMYVVNVSENMDFLEDTHESKGCAFSYHVTKTDYGVAWFNAFGVYFYDGKQVTNLLEKKGMRLISESDWETFIKDGTDDTDMSSAHIAYVPKKRQLLIKNENTDVYIYDFVLRAWMKGASKITVNTNMTNFVLNGNQDLIYLSNTASDIMTWSPDSSASSGFVLRTRDIDFGDPSIRKKIYKVYITYKTGGTTNVQVKYDVDGGTAFNKTFQDGTNFTSNELDNDGSGAWTQSILKPSTSSEANNKYSFAIKFTTDGIVPSTFEINDISIVYRTKGVK